MEKVLITGIAGFIGSHLSDFLLNKKFDVYGIYYEPKVSLNFFDDRVKIYECDIRDKGKLRNIIKDVNPSMIFHLAAQSYPVVSWEKPQETIEVNVIGTVNLFEIIKELNIDPVVLVACSSAEYGFVNSDEVPIKENRILKPLHPYGVSKVAQELLGYQYFKNDSIKSIMVRIFNTTGPRKVNDVCSDFTKKIVEIEVGKRHFLDVGNLESKRAIMDVRDLVNGLFLLIQNGNFGEVYNISSDKVYRIGDLLEIMKKKSKKDFEVKRNSVLMRPTDEPIIFGDSSKLKEITGWEQRIDIEKTIENMLDFWREYV